MGPQIVEILKRAQFFIYYTYEESQRLNLCKNIRKKYSKISLGGAPTLRQTLASVKTTADKQSRQNQRRTNNILTNLRM
jgi:hypothetical protein